MTEIFAAGGERLHSSKAAHQDVLSVMSSCSAIRPLRGLRDGWIESLRRDIRSEEKKIAMKA